MSALPAEVTGWGARCATRAGIDIPDGISLAAEAWAFHDPMMWRVVAWRRCVDHRRHVSGQGAVDRRPQVILDDRPVEFGADDPDLDAVEVRTDLAAAICDLCDTDLAALARVYWLHAPAKPHAVDVARAIRRAQRGPQPAVLSPRQHQIAQLIADGMSNKQIAAALHLAEDTVKSTLSNVYRRIGARDRAHAVALCMRAGWIT